MIWGFLCIALLISQLDTQHLVLATIGAGTYALLQLKIRQQTPPKKACSVYCDENERRPCRRESKNPNPSVGIRQVPKPTPLFSPPAQTASAKPLEAPIFKAKTFEGEVQKLLKELKPS